MQYFWRYREKPRGIINLARVLICKLARCTMHTGSCHLSLSPLQVIYLKEVIIACGHNKSCIPEAVICLSPLYKYMHTDSPKCGNMKAGICFYPWKISLQDRFLNLPLHCKNIWVTSTIFWSSQLHACCVGDTLQNFKRMLPICFKA